FVPLGDELLIERRIILDDAAVDDGHAPAGEMRVSVRLGHAALRGPAGVRDAESAGQCPLGELVLELRDLANRAAEAELTIALQHGHAGRVVAAVLEALQTLDENRDDVAFRDRSDDTAHSSCVLTLRSPANASLGFLLGPLPAGHG